jgi:hypothetical protein
MYIYVQLCYILNVLIYFYLLCTFQQKFYGVKLETKDQIKKESWRSASLTNKQRTHDDKMCDECAAKIFLPLYPIQNFRVEPYLLSVFHDDNHARHCICHNSDSFYQTFISAPFLCSTWSVSCYKLYKSLHYKPQIKPPLVNFQIFLPTNLRCRGIALPNNLVSIKWLCSIKVDCLSRFLHRNSGCHKFDGRMKLEISRLLSKVCV